MIAVAKKPPLYSPGELVRHRRYDYRGVIVAIDLECKADESWYQSNRTQPDRNQPWYHVLVDGRDTTTYVAQSNLEPAADLSRIEHPLLEFFFVEFVGGRYLRNDVEWPGV